MSAKRFITFKALKQSGTCDFLARMFFIEDDRFRQMVVYDDCNTISILKKVDQ